MSDIVLISPADHTELRERLGLKAPPLNLMYLASSLREHGYSVRIIDDNVEEAGPQGVAASIGDSPLAVGVTAATSTLRSAEAYAAAVKERDGAVPTVLGGPHVTFLPEETLMRDSGFDLAVLGEGEDTLAELAGTLEDGSGLGSVRGLAYRDGDKVLVNPPRPLREDIDGFPPPARDLVDLGAYKDPVNKKPIGTMITSRGCVFGCRYCASSRMMGSRFRARRPELIVDEMESLVDLGMEDIEIIDDNFVLDRRRAVAVAKEMKARGVEVGFSASSRVDTVSRPLLAELHSAGLSSLYLGIESGCQRVLDIMGKGTTVPQIQDAVSQAKDEGINVLGSFILGYPGETLKEMDQTIRLSIKLGIDFAQFSLLTPYPGTPIFEELRARGLLATEDYDKYTAMDPIVDYDRLGPGRGAVSRKLTWAYMAFYLRPSYIIKHPYMLAMIPGAIFRSKGDRKRKARKGSPASEAGRSAGPSL